MHYFVAVDDCHIPKDQLHEFTYQLSHMYYNWEGPIKVPAPCMYAHKIAYHADLFT